ncbi:MAG: hypothetical protein QW794_05950 [Thermosphaera sp.]
MFRFVKSVLGLVAGIAAGLMSINGVPVSLMLFAVRAHQLSSSHIVNMVVHVALNTVAWILIGAALAKKKNEWGAFAWFAVSTVLTATALTALYIIMAIIAILALAPGL